MTIMTRITRLFKADINGILDCIEEPRAMLKQAIRDMEAEVDGVARAVDEAGEEIKRFSSRTENLLADLEEVKNQIQLSFKADNEELARHFVKKKLDVETRLKSLELNVEAARKKRQQAEERRQAYRKRLDDIRSKAEALSDDQLTTSWQGDAEDKAVVSGCEVEIEFLQQKELWQKNVN